MKTSFFLSGLCLVLLMGIASCKDDDDAPSSVQGAWQGTSAEIDFKVFGVVVQSETDDSFDAVITFEEGGALTVNDAGETASGTWEQRGSTLTIATDYDYSGVNLSGDFTIEKNSGSQLILFTERDHTVTDPDSGTDIDGTIQATLYFDKLP